MLCKIDHQQVFRLRSGIEEYLAVTKATPKISVFCFGSSADLTKAPPGIRIHIENSAIGGVWLSRICCVVIVFARVKSIRKVLLHELTHAYLHLLTDGFPFLRAVAEGFARRAEYLVPDEQGDTEWQRTRHWAESTRGQTYWPDDSVMSVMELLSSETVDGPRWAPSDALRLTELSFWLNVFLFRLGRQRPILRSILREIQERDLRAPENVYAWILDASGLSAEELERRFYQFCTTGELPDDVMGDAEH